jgi:BirA family biotin operon repressor/biotin-[acetyl-CoA-carboxylase] ligase
MSPHPADDPFPGGASLIDSLDRTAVCRAAGLAGIEILAEATSTMDRARELAAGGDVPLPVAVIAERQTAGRGRRGARWWQPPGSLATSLVIDASRVTAPGRPVSPLWSLACGVALAESIIDLEPTVEPLVRWPNDVVTGGRKLAGILVETAPGGRVIFGIGVNTTGSSAEAPAPLRQRVGTLPDLTGRALCRGRLLVALVPRFLSLLGETSRDPGVLVERYRPLCSLTGSEVTVHREDGRRIVGICHGIDADGALVLDTAVGLVHLVSGSLTDPLDVWRGDRPEGHAGPAG